MVEAVMEQVLFRSVLLERRPHMIGVDIVGYKLFKSPMGIEKQE